MHIHTYIWFCQCFEVDFRPQAFCCHLPVAQHAKDKSQVNNRTFNFVPNLELMNVIIINALLFMLHCLPFVFVVKSSTSPTPVVALFDFTSFRNTACLRSGVSKV